jgi:hypothetical protein
VTGNTTQNARGEWVPSIPVPFYSWFPHYRCPECRAAYWTRPGYKGHYSYVHILGKP